jgi:Pyridoxamine 5'-phosphate oxidase
MWGLSALGAAAAANKYWWRHTSRDLTITEKSGDGMREQGYDGGLGLAQPAKGSQPLERAEAMRLLASVDYGRVVFTFNALPAIRPVNHLVDDGRIIIRTWLTTAISTVVRSADAGVVVGYEADSFDPHSRTGWSVVVTGRAHTITDPDQVSDYERLLLPWVNHAHTVVAIEPGIVNGFRIIATEPQSAGNNG